MQADPKIRTTAVLWGYAVVITLALTIFILVSAKRKQIEIEAHIRQNDAARGPWVKATRVKFSGTEKNVNVISETHPYAKATLYAKVSGYLKSVVVDKGDLVRKGQIIATIESPETEQAYRGARADWQNKRKITARTNILKKRGLISPQEAEQAIVNAQIAEATFRGLETLRNYEIIRAPFAGKVTARFADPGALIQNATNSQPGALPIITLAQTERLRIISFVDQVNAPYIKAGLPADIQFDGRPDLRLSGKVARVSGELDSKTKTLLVEIDYNNSHGDIVPGSYVNVSFKMQIPRSFLVPADSIIGITGKESLAVIDPESKIHFQDIKIIDNDGIQARIDGKVQEGTLILQGGQNDLHDGDTVQISNQVEPPQTPSERIPSSMAPR